MVPPGHQDQRNFIFLPVYNLIKIGKSTNCLTYTVHTFLFSYKNAKVFTDGSFNLQVKTHPHTRQLNFVTKFLRNGVSWPQLSFI